MCIRDRNWVYGFTDSKHNLLDLPSMIFKKSHIERLMKKNKYPVKEHQSEYGYEVGHVNIPMKDLLQEFIMLVMSQEDIKEIYDNKVNMDNLINEKYRDKRVSEILQKKNK